ncbi:hypothetical protein VNI00_016556 [Paramarasmius palmivorus]|uniref:Uncharacterized protein n=1 Tax=Paramarasmius palmivorus TaxID=297713 RepID=A0AAW0BBT7_9AGAR
MASYLPGSHSSDLFADRSKPGDVYETALSVLEDENFLSLARADYYTDFNRKLLDTWSGSYSFVDSNKKDLIVYACGEIVGSDHGTALGAMGNHFVGSSSTPNLLTDLSKPKHVIVLGKPSACSKKLDIEWHNQLVTLETLVCMDKDYDMSVGKEYQIKPPLKACEEGKANDAILVVPKIRNAPTKYRTKKRSYEETTNPEAQEEIVRDVGDDEKGPLPAGDLPKDTSIKLHARYDPRVFRDYGGAIFAQKYAQAVQLDFQDRDGELIPPWKYPDLLRPGTFLILALQPLVWVTKDKTGVVRKTYHLLIRSLRVFSTSDVAPENPIVVAHEDEGKAVQQDDLSVALRKIKLPASKPPEDTSEAGQTGKSVTQADVSMEEASSASTVGSDAKQKKKKLK